MFKTGGQAEEENLSLQEAESEEQNAIHMPTLIAKYFLHGVAYSLLVIGLTFLSILLLVALVVIGSILGLLLGFLIMIMAVGYVNSFLSGYFWNIQTPTKWSNLLVHGLVLMIALGLANIPFLILEYLIGTLTPVFFLVALLLLFVIHSIINGYIGKAVASMLGGSGSSLTRTQSMATYREKCPYCESVFVYKASAVRRDGTIKCFYCSHGFKIDVPVETQKKPDLMSSWRFTCPHCGRDSRYERAEIFYSKAKCHHCNETFDTEISG
jgi:transcription elongation factor Elf1